MCTRGYSNRELIPETDVDAKGYPICRRSRTPNDLNVVPHNREIALDCDGHANVEFAGSTYSVLYLFKYLHKKETPK
jgi:hypothetical protein